MSKAKFIYDSSKRMWYKHASSCHGAVLEQKMLYRGKVVTDPDFKIVTYSKDEVKLVPSGRAWWQLWKPKVVKKLSKGGQNVKEVQFRYFCMECGKQDSGVWDFKHKGVSEGQSALSKSAGVGSSPATPAKKVKR